MLFFFVGLIIFISIIRGFSNSFITNVFLFFNIVILSNKPVLKRLFIINSAYLPSIFFFILEGKFFSTIFLDILFKPSIFISSAKKPGEAFNLPK